MRKPGRERGTETNVDPDAKRQADILTGWFRVHARVLPWRENYGPYRALISEFMLQQTQVTTVIPYFERWMARWPDLASLAAADEAEVLKAWEGLGYYSRCRNLLKAARAMVEAGYETPPSDLETLRAFPGIGEYTAGAIVSIGCDLPVPAVDGNAERVISRLRGIEERAGSVALRREVSRVVASLLLHVSAREFNQALMDLGASLCSPKKPQCGECPWRGECVAFQQGRTEALPLPRMRATISQDSAWGLLALREGSVLLRRRPGEGLWAGLWEVPWFDRTADGDFWLDFEAWRAAQNLGLELKRDSLVELGAASFSFTTHHVRALVVSCEAVEFPDSGGENWRFATRDELGTLTLPAPGRKFLVMLEREFTLKRIV